MQTPHPYISELPPLAHNTTRYFNLKITHGIGIRSGGRSSHFIISDKADCNTVLDSVHFTLKIKLLSYSLQSQLILPTI